MSIGAVVSNWHELIAETASEASDEVQMRQEQTLRLVASFNRIESAVLREELTVLLDFLATAASGLEPEKQSVLQLMKSSH